jgi:endo-1,4-beta-xylanase
MKKFFIFALVLLFGIWGVINIAAQSLRSLAEQMRAKGHEFYIGCAVPSNFSSADQTIVKTEFDIVTCENDMKIGTISPNRGTYNYGGGDSLVNFARSNNMVFHGHCFIWHKYLPSWVDGTKSTMDTYISNVGTHFKGKIYVWDVVNEAFHRDGTYRINAIGSGGQDGASIWGQRQTKQYIEDAFRDAHAADPNAKLIYNDYAIESLDAKFNGMLAMLQDFVNRGVPINGVGFQMHVGPEYSEADAQKLAVKMQKIADLGLESYVTEMDGGAPDSSTTGLNKQGDIYYWVTKVCVNQPKCRALQVWGIRDSQSWRINPDDPVDRAVAPLIFNDSGAKKPAYYGIQKAMQEALTSPTPTPTRTPTPTPTSTFLRGDVNSDGQRNINDCLLIARYAAGLPVSNFNSALADTNCDSRIDINDALTLARLIAGLVGSLPCN